MKWLRGLIGEKGKRLLRHVPEFLAAAGAAAMLGAAGWTYLFGSPCRVEADCRGLGIDVDQMKSWEEQEKDGYSGIISMAGWRFEKQQIVTSVSTGRRKPSSVVAVYGSASLAYPAKLLSGNCELPWAEKTTGVSGGSGGTAENNISAAAAGSSGVNNGAAENNVSAAAAGPSGANSGAAANDAPVAAAGVSACILTAELSDALFGSFDTAGELVKVGDELLAVTGVIDREGCCLLRPAAGGTIEYAAFWLSERYQAGIKVRQRVRGS